MQNLYEQAKPVWRVYPKCNQTVETANTKCVHCGKTMQSVAPVRGLGVFLVVIGTVLLAGMSWLSVWMYRAISQSGAPGATTKFNGSRQMIVFIVFIFSVVLLIGFFAALQGIWQIVFGKRNKILVIIVLILGAVFMLTGLAAVIGEM